MSLDKPTLITDDYRQTAKARAVPYSIFMGGGWYLPPDPDPESARIAIRLFPALQATHPELVARARLSAADYTPIDLATARWAQLYPDGRPLKLDPWKRIQSQLAADLAAWHAPLVRPIATHLFQRIDADYAIENLSAGKGAYFGWEMGLGKTLGACMVIDGWDANFVFIACPNAAKQDPWVESLAKFCPWLEVVVVGNTKATRDSAMVRAKQLMDAGTPIALVCHYQAIPLIEGKNKRGWLKLGQWDLVICDEAHLFKTKGAKFTSSIRRLKKAGMLDLSGSVMSGDASKLFVPWQMFMPKRYRSQWRDWNDRFMEVVAGDYGQIVLGPELTKLDEFRAELGEVLTVRLAKDHLDVPEPVVVHHSVPLSSAQDKIYHKVADDLIAELPDGTTLATVDGAPLRTALRRVTGGVPSADGGLISSKLDKVQELVDSAGDSQIVVFTWHKAPGVELVRRLRASGEGVGLINGDVPRARREKVLDLFKRGGYRVLVATIATLSASVNLQNASVVIMAEESDDPVDNAQAPGRVFRQGQTRTGSLHYVRAANTVDDLEVWPTSATKQELRRLVLGASS